MGLGTPKTRAARERACGRAARERTCGGEHVGQHADSQDLDVTKASHCTGSMSPVLASSDAGERTQVRTDESKEESTAAPTRISGR